MAKKKSVQKSAKKVPKKLYRAGKDDSLVAGVCAGIADYFEVDPTIIRLLWILFIFGWGTGLLAYLILWVIVPRR